MKIYTSAISFCFNCIFFCVCHILFRLKLYLNNLCLSQNINLNLKSYCGPLTLADSLCKLLLPIFYHVIVDIAICLRAYGCLFKTNLICFKKSGIMLPVCVLQKKQFLYSFGLCMLIKLASRCLCVYQESNAFEMCTTKKYGHYSNGECKSQSIAISAVPVFEECERLKKINH